MSRVGTRKRLEDIPLNGDCSAWPPCRSRVRLCDRENTREEKLKSELSAVSRAARWCCSSKRVQAGDHILRAGQNREERQNSCSTAAHSAFRQRSCVKIIRGMEPLLWYAVDCIWCPDPKACALTFLGRSRGGERSQAMLLARIIVAMQVETTTALSTSVLQIYSRPVTGTAYAMNGYRSRSRQP